MGKINILKRVCYSPLAIRASRALGLRLIARNWYYRWARPRDGIFRIEVSGMTSQFYVRTPEELRVLESSGGAGGEQRVLELLISSLHAGDVVFDIGANVGLYSILLAKAVGNRGQVIAFEPESLSYEHLQENLKLNRLQNVRCIRKALGERNAQAKLYSSATIGSSTLVASDGTKDSAEVVDIVEGDSLVAAENLPLPRVVKIDVEGYEHAVIRGLRHTLAQPACELLCCEVHPSLLPSEVKPEDVLRLMKSLGFRRLETYPRWDKTFHLVGRKG